MPTAPQITSHLRAFITDVKALAEQRNGDEEQCAVILDSIENDLAFPALLTLYLTDYVVEAFREAQP